MDARELSHLMLVPTPKQEQSIDKWEINTQLI